MGRPSFFLRDWGWGSGGGGKGFTKKPFAPSPRLFSGKTKAAGLSSCLQKIIFLTSIFTQLYRSSLYV